MQKLQLIAAIIAKMNPKPLLDAIEIEYGRTARLVVIAATILAAVAIGYNIDGVMVWLGVQP